MVESLRKVGQIQATIQAIHRFGDVAGHVRVNIDVVLGGPDRSLEVECVGFDPTGRIDLARIARARSPPSPLWRRGAHRRNRGARGRR